MTLNSLVSKKLKTYLLYIADSSFYETVFLKVKYNKKLRDCEAVLTPPTVRSEFVWPSKIKKHKNIMPVKYWKWNRDYG